MGLFSRFFGSPKQPSPEPPAVRHAPPATPPGPIQYTREELVTQAERVGYFRQDELVPKELADEAVRLDEAGLPTVVLLRDRGRLNFSVPELGVINPHGPELRRVGIYSFRVRGDTYYPAENARANTKPGATLTLKREPNNPHDPNAIAICNPRTGGTLGYVNKGNARAIARRMDSGEVLACRTLRGGDQPTEVIITTAPIMEHLFSHIVEP